MITINGVSRFVAPSIERHRRLRHATPAQDILNSLPSHLLSQHKASLDYDRQIAVSLYADCALDGSSCITNFDINIRE